MPFRGTYMAGLPRDRAERLSWCERLAALRMNAVVIEDDIWWRLDDPVQRKVAQDAFDDFRAYGIDPIPELQSFGWGHLVLRKDPMCAEGQWVEREEIRLTGEDAVELTHPNILRTESTDIVLRGPDGVVLREGQDYRVIAIAEDDEARVETVDDPVEGVTEHVYRPEARKRRIQRVVGGRIADGTTVQASYDYVARVNQQNCPYCPSEPRVAEIMVDAVRDTVKHLKPTTIHIGHDEPAVMNSDSRCIARGLSNAELLAEDVQRLYDAARELDPEIDIMMWADAVNPYHNGLMFPDDPTSDALDLLPKDVILNVWYYGADQPLSKGAESLRCLASKGFATTGSPWFDVTCATRWSQACYASRLRGENCLGVLYTSWGGRWDALATSGNTAWKPPDIAAQPEVDGG